MKMLSILLLIFSSFVSATEFNTQAFMSCSKIENDSERLICFDQAIATNKVTNLNQPPAKEQKEVVSKTKPEIDSEDSFGLEYKQISQLDSTLNSKVTKVSKKPRGELIINLENGHIWHQIGTNRFKIKEGETAIISRGVFNSFILKVAGRKQGIKVKRK